MRGAGGSPLAFVRAHRRVRIALLCAALAPALLAGGWLFLRHSPLSSVEHVRVSGVHGAEAKAIEAALVAAAHGMSTLDIHDGTLRAAVARFHVVSAITAVPAFPHGLRIEVSEQPAVAALVFAGARTAVAANGTVLGPNLLSASLPTLGGYSLPAPGAHLHGPSLLAALAILGAAPAPLARRVARVYAGPEGLTAAMSNGLLVYFGDGSLPHAKWLSLARVLADPSSAGASYIDVRLPARPAAGFPAGVTPPGAPTSGEEASTLPSGGSSESTVGAIAESLSASTPATSAPSEHAAGGASSEAETEAAHTSGEPSETPSAPEPEATEGGATSIGG